MHRTVFKKLLPAASTEITRNGFRRQRRSVWARLCCCVWLAFFLWGCGNPSPAKLPEQVQADAAEREFNWAMERLDRALQDFRPRGKGVLRVSRDMKFQLIPPNKETPQFTAQVTVQTTSTYIHDQAFSTLQQNRAKVKAQQKRAEPLWNDPLDPNSPLGKSIDNPLAETYVAQMEEITAESDVPLTPEARVSNRQRVEKKTFDLIYKDQRWQLQTELDKDYERLWFEYALQQ